MKTLKHHILPLTLAATFGALSAQGVWAKPVSMDFSAYDSNRDGVISQQEFQSQGGMAKAFEEGDTNHDGKLNKDELIKASAQNDRILAGNKIDDAWITAKVKTMLLKDDIVEALRVDVDTRKGNVQLSGSVEDPAEIAKAESIARNTKGVKSVKNNLQVKR